MKNKLVSTIGVLKSIVLISLVVFGCGSHHRSNDIETGHVDLNDSIWFEYEDVAGVGYVKDVSRRDPSDIIKVGSQYYVWYTRIPSATDGKRTALYNSGYYGTIWYASSSDGYTWVERGEALGPEQKGGFDSHAVFTPNILKYGGKYYLYYTGVAPTPGNPHHEFENNSETDITAIGMAVADSPDGPFERIGIDPVLKISDDAREFDSYRIDDASLVVKDGSIWLYYKGRSRLHGKSGPAKTQMGVAFAEKPEGPYRKNANPLVDKSHEVLVWNQDGSIAALASINKSINVAPDGLNFSMIRDNLARIPTAPGLYRPHLTDHSVAGLPGWGISHKNKDGDIYLTRFSIKSKGK